jgi:hypothetical protein
MQRVRVARGTHRFPPGLSAPHSAFFLIRSLACIQMGHPAKRRVHMNASCPRAKKARLAKPPPLDEPERLGVAHPVSLENSEFRPVRLLGFSLIRHGSLVVA